jgi:DNA-binding transcriptional ArsR family regulator
VKTKPRRVDILVDDKRVTTEGSKIVVEIEGVPVFKSPPEKYSSVLKTSQFQAITTQMLFKVASATFAHPDRFRIVENVAGQPRTFGELKQLFKMTSPTLNYHLGKLLEAWVIYKTEDEKYSTTLLGELLLDYFAGFLEETRKLQSELESKETGKLISLEKDN